MADFGRAYPVDFATGPSSSDDLNKLPRGFIWGAERVGNASNIDGTAVVLTYELIVPEDGRRQRFTANVMIRSETIGGVQARLAIEGVQIDRKNFESLGGAADVVIHLMKDKELAQGTYTVDLIVGRSGDGANLVTAVAGGETDEFGVIESYCDDVGPAVGGS